MKDNISCKQAVNYISLKEEKKLTSWKRFQLWKHLAGCSLCRTFNVQNKVIAAALSGYQTPGVTLTQEQKTEIVQAVLNKD
jgi:sarcosine oxidase delta subunit